MGYKSASFAENKKSMTTTQNAIKIVCKMEIYIGMSKAEQQLLTKSDAAFMIPIAFLVN
jgi:hypothetical protein